MSTPHSNTIASGFIWNRYRHNFSRHLLAVARYLQTGMMQTLQEQCGHSNLRLGFAPYITLIGTGDRRVADLAEILGISRQACNQAIKQVEAAGYIERKPDPDDRRAKQLTLSVRGNKLRRDGLRIVARFDREFVTIVGENSFAECSRSLQALYRGLSLGLLPESDPHLRHTGMGGLLPRLSDHVLQRLMFLTRAKGHHRLKLSFAQVLTLIQPSGARIQQIASTQDVSKQAISAIASELEELGYLQRQVATDDARQILLQFTERGQQLITDSVQSVDELEIEFAAIIGKTALDQLTATIEALYTGLRLEQDIFEQDAEQDAGQAHTATSIRELARQLQRQLSDRDSQVLARLLLKPSTHKR